MLHYKFMSPHEFEMASQSIRQLQALGTSGDPIERLRLVCLSRGAIGILNLGRMFRRMDQNGNKQLNEAEFLVGLRDSGMEINPQEAKGIFQTFDPKSSGGINTDEFLKAIHPPMSESRKLIIEKAFKKMDKLGRGEISIDTLRRVYNVEYHPLYRSGEKSKETIFARFLANFEQGAIKDGQVTKEEFVNYYAAISASIEDDGYFDLMMRQCYKL